MQVGHAVVLVVDPHRPLLLFGLHRGLVGCVPGDEPFEPAFELGGRVGGCVGGDPVVELDDRVVVTTELVNRGRDQGDPVGVDLAGLECLPGPHHPAPDPAGLCQAALHRPCRQMQRNTKLIGRERSLKPGYGFVLAGLGLDAAQVFELQHVRSDRSLDLRALDLSFGDLVEDHLAGVEHCFHTSNLGVATDTSFWRCGVLHSLSGRLLLAGGERSGVSCGPSTSVASQTSCVASPARRRHTTDP